MESLNEPQNSWDSCMFIVSKSDINITKIGVDPSPYVHDM